MIAARRHAREQHSILHPSASRVVHPRREIAITCAAIAFTAAATAVAFLATLVRRDWAAGMSLREGIESGLFFGVILFLLYGTVVYQLSRLGHLRRLARHRPASDDELTRLFDDERRPLAILVPSYKEDPETVRLSLLSAALQDYPRRRVVLLIDDPPAPADAASQAGLAAARALPAEVESLLAPERLRLEEELRAWRLRRVSGVDLRAEVTRLACLHRSVAAWFARLASSWKTTDHMDAHFVHCCLQAPAREHLERAEALERRGHDELALPSVEREYRWLAGRFAAEVTSFERKKYVNLSHEPNKAMNLNSYLDLVGGCYMEIATENGTALVRTDSSSATVAAPEADYLITLDADSILAHRYGLKLVNFLEQPGNERVAVIQTPYSAVPDAPGVLERVAGATTDIQYIVHQGFTAYGATFWVGANAVLRATALHDIRMLEHERGYAVPKFIQDRTVIEDTESSVDLICLDWTLVNYPERLSFSATPPDFGSLIVQRRRWANGGLIILPKLLLHLLRSPARASTLLEGFVRIHYLTSIAGGSVALLLLLVYPFGSAAESIWLTVAAGPYFFLYARDLQQAGYRLGDALRVYALNLLLLPVNLAGAATSVYQGVTRKKIPFKRTPKVGERTMSPASYVIVQYILLAYLVVVFAVDVGDGRFVHAGYALANAALLTYALRALIGFREAFEDITQPLRRWTAGRTRRRRDLERELVALCERMDALSSDARAALGGTGVAAMRALREQPARA